MNPVPTPNSSRFLFESSKTPERPQRKRNFSQIQSSQGKKQKLFEKRKWTQRPLTVDLNVTKKLTNMKIEEKDPCIKRNLLIPETNSKNRSFSWDLPGKQSIFLGKESLLLPHSKH